MTPLVPRPTTGRVFTTTRRVRLGDADRHGRLRLDALARLLQDVGNDDFADAGLDPTSPWLARQSTVVATRWPELGERIEVATWCGGTGSRWAERRSSVTNAEGASVEVATLWVHVNGDGRPSRLPDWFVDTYAAAAGGRQVSTRIDLPALPSGLTSTPWSVRVTDLDVLGHVNNAVAWAPVEELCGRRQSVPSIARLAWHGPIELDDVVELQADVDSADGAIRLWLVVDGSPRVAAVASGHRAP